MHAFLKTGKLGAPSKNDNKDEAKEKRKEERIAHTPWVEKYRPRSVEDVVQQEEVVAVLKKSLKGFDLPNLLFYGPPGTGKTSTILAAARELFGDLYKSRILELNASDERGIQVVRQKVKSFAQLTACSTRKDGRACPPFKIIILDEADSMTNAAQAALRRTMEKESRTTRFCLICNYVSRIIDPLISRCAKFRFKPLGEKMLQSRLRFICNEENVSCDDEVLSLLVESSDGDLRKAITWLQSSARLRSANQPITKEDVNEITGVVPISWIKEFFEACQSNNYDTLAKYVDKLMLEGYAAAKIVSQAHDYIIEMPMDDETKSIICDKLAESDFHLLQGASEYLQLMSIGVTVMSLDVK